MISHMQPSKRIWLLGVIIVLIVAAHLVVPYLWLHMGLSATLLSGALVLLVLKHLGVIALVVRRLRARR